MTNPTPLTENELRAAAYFAVGVTSEGSIGGRDVSYRLRFAGSVARDGRMSPVGKKKGSGSLPLNSSVTGLQVRSAAPQLYCCWRRIGVDCWCFSIACK